MSEYIDKAKLYNKLREREGVIQTRVDETPATINGALSPCYTRYSAQLNEVTRCRELVADFPIADVIPIPDGATNGEMFKTMFPNVSFGEFMDGIMILNNNECEFWHNWWDAPYKGEKE